MASDVGVLVVYPGDGEPGDDAWLAEAVAQHGGELSDLLLTSLPGKRGVSFQDLQAADAFVAQLNATGRWRVQSSS